MSNTMLEPPEVKETSSLHMISAMSSVGCIAGILIVLTFQLTLPGIELQQREYLKHSVFEVLPHTTKVITYKVQDNGEFKPVPAKGKKGLHLYAGYNDAHELTGVAVEAQGQGFQDAISILYGYSPIRECIVGMKVLGSKETPGLGDKIEKDADFRKNFEELDVTLNKEKNGLVNPITLVKKGAKTNPWEIDAITGATISSRAIATILGKARRKYFL